MTPRAFTGTIVEINERGKRVVWKFSNTRTARWRRELYALGCEMASAERRRPRHPSAARGWDAVQSPRFSWMAHIPALRQWVRQIDRAGTGRKEG